ncbi:pyridoxamine 5'-phosphate oxidase family protein [Streptomyces sp. 5-8]|uniref:Pyridoxamine 5'-phosphate oxidase family protein n=1 Tax=Streptomyces musisoli TaxID=2802280 RepID=A0ABS1PAE3_9ACTN|nr:MULTISPECIES: pyridoxamine 5'-phosphate oxidase family protein [Streptomyces]MBL1109012.1 pyridoxamine 5'-phosphate oxidase family protein [Streptomyces musisoli]MBY8845744.1 pyridoxamine 5'-phosphate oxidase family protein [Streptomyces sp. SP2-10]
MIRDHSPTRRRIDLDRAEALRLLGSVPLGRLVFTRQALPTVRPVIHIVDGDDIVIRTHEGCAVTSRTRQPGGGVVVAYEADVIDPLTRAGWSVVITGYARLVTDPGELMRIRGLLEPLVPQQETDHTVRIHPEMVTGVLITATDEAR